MCLPQRDIGITFQSTVQYVSSNICCVKMHCHYATLKIRLADVLKMTSFVREHSSAALEASHLSPKPRHGRGLFAKQDKGDC